MGSISAIRCAVHEPRYNREMEGVWSTTNRISGDNGALWLAHDGAQQWGPYDDAQMLELIRSKRVPWNWNLWRQGMEKWLPAGRLFTFPDLDEVVRLRNFNYVTVPKAPRKRRPK